MLTGVEVNNSFPTHRIMLLKSSDGISWTQVNGSGTDGAVVEETGTDKYGEHGFNDPVIYWRPGTNDWGMYCSGYRKAPNIDDEPGQAPWNWDGVAPWNDKAGWAIFRLTSPDLITWTFANGGDPVIYANGDGLRQFTGITNNELSGLSDTNGFEVDMPVWVFGGSGSAEHWLLSRVREKTSTTLELYHRSGGITTGGLGVVAINAASLTPHALVQEGPNAWRLYGTGFQPLINANTNQIGNCETVISWTSTSPDGPWTLDVENSLAVPLNHPDRDGSHSVENLKYINVPTAFSQNATPEDGPSLIQVTDDPTWSIDGAPQQHTPEDGPSLIQVTSDPTWSTEDTSQQHTPEAGPALIQVTSDPTWTLGSHTPGWAPGMDALRGMNARFMLNGPTAKNITWKVQGADPGLSIKCLASDEELVRMGRGGVPGMKRETSIRVLHTSDNSLGVDTVNTHEDGATPDIVVITSQDGKTEELAVQKVRLEESGIWWRVLLRR